MLALRRLIGLRNPAHSLAKLLPALPRLLHDYLQQRPDDLRRDLKALMDEQRRTNRLLQRLLWCGVGFLLGLVVMQVFVRLHSFF